MAARSVDDIFHLRPNIVADLPLTDTQRWSAQRKALVVNAVRNGVISLEQACCSYRLSVEEFLAWQRALETHGVGALRGTRVQYYRNARQSAGPVEPRY
jgi:hypothetical protein